MPNRDRAEKLLPIATVNRTSARSVLCSATEHDRGARLGPTRLDSIYAVFPKMVMVERNRHRGLSLSDRSSRAVPPEKLIAEIRSGEGLAMPAVFRRRTTGMGGGEEYTGDELIEHQVFWVQNALDAADSAEAAMAHDEAKETVNRRLDPYIYAHTLMTGTRDAWLNFLGLRLDGGADPTIQALAREVFAVYKAAVPTVLRPGEWHLPFVAGDDWELAWSEHGRRDSGGVRMVTEEQLRVLKELSAARCAHLSYNDLETGARMTVERALAICSKLRDSRPFHPSPFEHLATPDSYGPIGSDLDAWQDWRNRDKWGNFYGWIQFRKTMPGEAVAPLPAGYEL